MLKSAELADLLVNCDSLKARQECLEAYCFQKFCRGNTPSGVARKLWLLSLYLRATNRADVSESIRPIIHHLITHVLSVEDGGCDVLGSKPLETALGLDAWNMVRRSIPKRFQKAINQGLNNPANFTESSEEAGDEEEDDDDEDDPNVVAMSRSLSHTVNRRFMRTLTGSFPFGKVGRARTDPSSSAAQSAATWRRNPVRSNDNNNVNGNNNNNTSLIPSNGNNQNSAAASTSTHANNATTTTTTTTSTSTTTTATTTATPSTNANVNPTSSIGSNCDQSGDQTTPPQTTTTPRRRRRASSSSPINQRSSNSNQSARDRRDYVRTRSTSPIQATDTVGPAHSLSHSIPLSTLLLSQNYYSAEALRAPLAPSWPHSPAIYRRQHTTRSWDDPPSSTENLPRYEA